MAKNNIYTLRAGARLLRPFTCLEKYGALEETESTSSYRITMPGLRLLPETEGATGLLAQEELVSCSRSYLDQFGDSGCHTDIGVARLI